MNIPVHAMFIIMNIIDLVKGVKIVKCLKILIIDIKIYIMYDADTFGKDIYVVCHYVFKI